jgi:hypothetical protein
MGSNIFRLVGYIHSVIEPKNVANGFDSPKSKNKLNKTGKPIKSPSQRDADVIVLSDDEGKSTQPEVKSPTSSKNNSTWPDAKSYEYMVKLKRTRNTPSNTPEIITVKQSCIR